MKQVVAISRVCIGAKTGPQIENWFNTCAGTIYREMMIFLWGGGLHFSNWRGRNTEYFAMTRMALGIQTYGAGKLSPTPHPPVIPQEVGQEWDKLLKNKK